MAEPNYTFAKGHGRFGMGYPISTALGNFEQGSIEAESAVVAQWLTSGPRVPGPHRMAPAVSPPDADQSPWERPQRPLPQWIFLHSENGRSPIQSIWHTTQNQERWDQLCAWLTGNPIFRLQLLDHKQALRDHMDFGQEAPDPGNKARRTVPSPELGSSSSVPGAVGPPPSPSPCGWSHGWWQ